MRRARTTTLPPEHARTGAWIATVFLTGSTVLSLWIAFTGQRVSGGLPWLPDAMNQRLGHLMFGFSGIICACLAMLAFRDATRSVNSRKRSAP
jgi:hypothetical protein